MAKKKVIKISEKVKREWMMRECGRWEDLGCPEYDIKLKDLNAWSDGAKGNTAYVIMKNSPKGFIVINSSQERKEMLQSQSNAGDLHACDWSEMMSDEINKCKL
tara:strand:+ start:172 stop:483 length:312 start_codon:yes stop_codon:yes gene_type:complete